MKWTKEPPKKDGFYWIKWRDNAPFIDYLYVEEKEDSINDITTEYITSDKEYYYSDSPIQQPE